MKYTKIKIALTGVSIVGIILGNFWYYIHTSKTGETASVASKNTGDTVAEKIHTPDGAIQNTDASKKNIDSVNTGDTAQSGVILRKRNIPKTMTASATLPSITSNGEEEQPKSGTASNYITLEKILVDKSWVGNGNKDNYSHYWGNENISFLGDSLKIRYPKGSNAPSNSPRGGAGFVYSLPKSYDSLSLSYSIRFEDGFDFVKGGKLPGLCGGNCARGDGMSTGSGFSLRFVWRQNGYLDFMSFLPNTVKAGNYSGEKMFKLEPGREYIITQQVKLNDPGIANGIINILVDGVSVYKKSDVVLRLTNDVQINSFLFSTFFGGKDDTYSSSKDTSILFGKFKISDTF